MKTLITGGAGFIGSHLTKHCIALGHDVVVLDDLSEGYRDHVPEKASFVYGSITDQTLIVDLFKTHQFTYVYHLAAYAAEGLSHFIRRFNYNNNLIGSINLINESIKHTVKCFVYTSSIAVYGTAQIPMDEKMTPSPEDPYGIAKMAVELDLRAARELFGLNYIIFRPHNVYGEHQNIADPYRNVIGIFMNQIMQGKPLTIFGDGSQTRAFSYIDDVAPYIARSVHIPSSYNHIINLGADKPYTLNELAEVVCSIFGVKPQIQYLPQRNEVLHNCASHEKANRLLGIIGSTDLVTGIKKMAEWAQKVGSRKSMQHRELELTKNIPAIWE